MGNYIQRYFKKISIIDFPNPNSPVNTYYDTYRERYNQEVVDYVKYKKLL